MSIKDAIKLFGPAFIVMVANTDVASIIAGVANGEVYGYGLIWFLLILF
jgi:Mn2+/Fe2+ NRAMP family transporter